MMLGMMAGLAYAVAYWTILRKLFWSSHFRELALHAEHARTYQDTLRAWLDESDPR